MWFKKKEKKVEAEQVPKKKKGCLKPFLISVVLLVVLGISGVFAIRDTLKVFGVNLKTFNEYVEWLNENVDETTLVTNPIKENDITTFKQKAIASGIEMFDASGNPTIDMATIKILNSTTWFDYEIGALINSLSKDDADKQVYELLELSIEQNVGIEGYKLKSVVKLDLTEIKNDVGKMAKSMPNTIYLTSIGEIYVVGSRVQTRNNVVTINQLSAEKNSKIMDLVNEISESAETDSDLTITDINNYVVTEVLTSLVQKTQEYSVTASFGNHTFSLNVPA